MNVKDEIPNGTPNTLIPFDGVSKLGAKSKGDHAAHFWGWLEKSILRNLVWKCSYAYDTIEKGPMMWVSFIIDGNKEEGKRLTIKRKVLKWARANSAPPKGSL